MSDDLLGLVRECGVAVEEFPGAPEAVAQAHRLKSLGFEKAAEKVLAVATVKAKMGRLAPYRYVRITPEKIKAFLGRKAGEYDKKYLAAAAKAQGVSRYFGALNGGFTTRTIMVSASRRSTEFDPSLGASLNASGAAGLNDAYAAMIYGYGGFAAEPAAARFAVSTVHALSSEKGHVGQFVWTEVPVKQYEGIPPAEVLRSLEEHRDRQVFDYFTVASVNAVPDPLLLGRIDGSVDRYYLAQWGKDVSLDDII